MGASLSLDKSQAIARIRFEGDLTDELLFQGYARVRQWFARDRYYSNLTDFSAVSSFQVSTNAVARLAADAPLVPDGFLRIVVAPQDQAFGMARMFESLGSATRDTVHVVRTCAEAYRLFGVASLNFDPIDES
jgi:hypothetical protein